MAPPANKQALVDAIPAAKPRPRASRSVDRDQAIVEVLAAIRDSTVGGRGARQAIDRRGAALVVRPA